ncbi:MAG: hypothetical protein NTV46_03335 [Verrucomicrobia bacterium]|nr:hypothetical protein [Verrucomicrobiota bacterium]
MDRKERKLLPLEILVEFTRTTGHEHQYLQQSISNFTGLLMDMGDTQARAEEKINQILEPIRNQ